MSELWAFLTAPENQGALSWLGGGLVVVCGGLWTVIRFFAARKQSGGSSASGSKPQRMARSRVSADRGGIAGGGDVHIETRTGTPPGHLILLVLAMLGATLIAVTLAGNRVSVTNGTGIGGDVSGSSVTTQQ